MAFQYSHVLGSTCFCTHAAVTNRLDVVSETKKKHMESAPLQTTPFFLKNSKKISFLEDRSTG